MFPSLFLELLFLQQAVGFAGFSHFMYISTSIPGRSGCCVGGGSTQRKEWMTHLPDPLGQAASAEAGDMEQGIREIWKDPRIGKEATASFPPLPFRRQGGPTSPSSPQGLRGSACLHWPWHFHKLLGSCFCSFYSSCCSRAPSGSLAFQAGLESLLNGLKSWKGAVCFELACSNAGQILGTHHRKGSNEAHTSKFTVPNSVWSGVKCRGEVQAQEEGSEE